MDIWDSTKHSKEEIQRKLEKFQEYQKRYKNYPGSPYDDARLGIYGYTVRDERGYISRQVRTYKKALAWMSQQGKEEISDREIFYNCC